MNAELQNITDKLVDSFDPNEIAFALATSYNSISRKRETSDFNYKIFKKIATQFARVNGNFPVGYDDRPKFYYNNTNDQRPG